MTLKKTLVTGVAAAALLLGACSSNTGSETERSASSKATYLSLENQLNDWWGGSGIPITWKVTETVNADWDGGSRPDNPPPQGLQGLVQEAFSNPKVTRLEVNYNPGPDTKTRRFVLTPTISVDGEVIDLPSISFLNRDYMAYSWEMNQGGVVCTPNTPTPTVTESWSARTPRGLLMYDVVLTCPDGIYEEPAKILFRNYQKN